LDDQEVDQYSEIPVAQSQGKLWKSWNNLVCQFFRLTTIYTIVPEFIVFIQGPLPHSTPMESPKTGSRPMHSMLAACLANLSASLVPSILLWPEPAAI